MRIALCHPTYWPEVRRGSERVVHDLGVGLAQRGHDVTLMTSHRAPSRTTVEEGVRVVRAWRPPGLPPARWYESFLLNAPGLAIRLARGRFDLAHGFFPSDSWAATRAHAIGGPPTVVTFHGTPTREYLVARRYRLEMIQQTLARAAAVTVLSAPAAAAVRRYLLVDPFVLPAGVVAELFRSPQERTPQPSLLCAADLSDPRKRGELLLAAFAELRRSRPDARLMLAGGAGAAAFRGPGVEHVRCDDTASLAAAYASCWTSVLPSVEEAFGLVLVESLAAGRPVVAARSGACPSIVTSQDVGVLFEPDDAGALARAMASALELAVRPGVEAACRAHADAWDWGRLVARYEELYGRVLAAGSQVRGVH